MIINDVIDMEKINLYLTETAALFAFLHVDSEITWNRRYQ